MSDTFNVNTEASGAVMLSFAAPSSTAAWKLNTWIHPSIQKSEQPMFGGREWGGTLHNGVRKAILMAVSAFCCASCRADGGMGHCEICWCGGSPDQVSVQRGSNKTRQQSIRSAVCTRHCNQLAIGRVYIQDQTTLVVSMLHSMPSIWQPWLCYAGLYQPASRHVLLCVRSCLPRQAQHRYPSASSC